MYCLRAISPSSPVSRCSAFRFRLSRGNAVDAANEHRPRAPLADSVGRRRDDAEVDAAARMRASAPSSGAAPIRDRPVLFFCRFSQIAAIPEGGLPVVTAPQHDALSLHDRRFESADGFGLDFHHEARIGQAGYKQ
jgi:hypothetical protein